MLRLIVGSCLLLLFAGRAQAGDNVCFEPNSQIMTADGFVAVRRIADEFSVEPRWSRHVQLRGPKNSVLMVEAELELMRAGVAINRIERVDQPAVDAECVVAEVVQSDRPYMALWHFWGPYFQPGSAEVTAAWARRLRYIVVGYRPGETKFCIDGHTDTAGTAEANWSLSHRRAEAVARELVRQGVSWDDTVVRAYGETRLARATADGVSEPLNRRVIVEPRERC